MRFLYSLLPLLIIMTGCASSSNSNNEKHSFTNLVTVEKPGSTKHNPSKVYVDSVKQITIDQKPALLVSGTFPDACTKLEEVTHRISDDSLSLNLKAWRNPDELCAQVLTPFSFIYDSLTKKELSSHSSVYINKTAYHY